MRSFQSATNPRRWLRAGLRYRSKANLVAGSGSGREERKEEKSQIVRLDRATRVVAVAIHPRLPRDDGRRRRV